MSGRIAGLGVQQRRLAVACAFVAMLVVPPVLHAVLSQVDDERESPAPPEFAEVGAGGEAGPTAEEMLEALERRLDAMEGSPPDSFADEIGLLATSRDVRVSDDGTVVGYLAKGGETEVMAQVAELFGLSGWQCVPLGAVTGATFVKDGGKLRWALVTCTGVGEWTSVVVRCPEMGCL